MRSFELLKQANEEIGENPTLNAGNFRLCRETLTKNFLDETKIFYYLHNFNDKMSIFTTIY
jgi:hypothetical protein